MVGATQESAGQPAPAEGDPHISPALETARVCLRECRSGRRLGILCQRLLSHICSALADVHDEDDEHEPFILQT